MTIFIGSGDAAQRTKRINVVGSVTYFGEAVVGALETAPVWRISQIDQTDIPNVTVTWASGSADFNKSWSDRLTYSFV